MPDAGKNEKEATQRSASRKSSIQVTKMDSKDRHNRSHESHGRKASSQER